MDLWCQENCNPYDVRNLENVNSAICEQLFKNINQHTNVKSMNEPHFFLFFMYIFDLHNLGIESKIRSMANPQSDFRWSMLTFQVTDYPSIREEGKERNSIESEGNKNSVSTIICTRKLCI